MGPIEAWGRPFDEKNCPCGQDLIKFGNLLQGCLVRMVTLGVGWYITPLILFCYSMKSNQLIKSEHSTNTESLPLDYFGIQTASFFECVSHCEPIVCIIRVCSID